ncbi:MAG: VTT domain-containing protein [Acetobacteraceae bacterium]|nr:VTT domain-containing protein [Acetobacteraceae bacterium]MBV8522796.1 VTT domain-containing protein [Acetobacteraceae bacterium]MBV8590057.1 VTT domain-containing protein [Acetobacteraceae bacterium]
MAGAGLSSMSTDAPLLAFASVLAGSLGIPVPAFAGLIFAGTLLSHWGGGPWLAVLSFACAMLGAAIGDITWFLLGRKHGPRVLALLCLISLTRETCIRRTADFFARQGLKLFLVARFIPGLSTVSAPVAGAAGVPLHRFYAYAAFGAALWIGTGFALGYFLAEQIGAMLLGLRRVGIDLGGVAFLLTLGYILYRWFRRVQLIRRLRMARISAAELAEMLAAGLTPVIIDARSAPQRTADPYVIPGALLWQNVATCPDLAKTGPVVIYCTCPNEVSAAAVARQMHKLGFKDVRPLLGGLDAWRAVGQPTAPIVEIGGNMCLPCTLVPQPS